MPADDLAMNSKMTVIFVKLAMLYLVVGSVLLDLSISNYITFNRDAVFIMELYGFVTMMVFGLSYVFLPGIAKGKFANYRLVATELVIFNAGIILFVLAASGLFQKAPASLMFAVGAPLLLLGIVIHAGNMWLVVGKRNIIAVKPVPPAAK